MRARVPPNDLDRRRTDSSGGGGGATAPAAEPSGLSTAPVTGRLADAPEPLVAAEVRVAIAGGHLGRVAGVGHVLLREDPQGGVLVERLGDAAAGEDPRSRVDV